MNWWGYEDAMIRNQEIRGRGCRFRGVLHLQGVQQRRGYGPRVWGIEEERRNCREVVAGGEEHTADAGKRCREEVAPPS